jgi:hypothetical protein
MIEKTGFEALVVGIPDIHYSALGVLKLLGRLNVA